MDSRIQALVHETKEKWGLRQYHLKDYEWLRDVNLFAETVYTLAMSWHPNHPEDRSDDVEPDGAAFIEVTVPDGKVRSIQFVGGRSFVDGPRFSIGDTPSVIRWVEKETGLHAQHQFRLEREKSREWHFATCVDGIPFYPPGTIDVRLNRRGDLIEFVNHADFPNEQRIQTEQYTLTAEKVIGRGVPPCIKVNYSGEEQKRSIYVIEEQFIANENRLPIATLSAEHGCICVKTDQPICWDQPAHGRPFKRKKLNLSEKLTAEQAFAAEASPAARPITQNDQQQCVRAVRDVLSRAYPDDSGQWRLTALMREHGYLIAHVQKRVQPLQWPPRKIAVILDGQSHQFCNFFDNRDLIGDVHGAGEETVTQAQAGRQLRKLLTLSPYYVYDDTRRQYTLCGRLDCDYAIDAVSGAVIALKAL